MRAFETKTLSDVADAVAPDGTAVRLLLTLPGGSFAHFELPAGVVSHAVAHRTVEEIWWVLSGRGRIWRRSGETESVVDAASGLAITHSPLPPGAISESMGDMDRSDLQRLSKEQLIELVLRLQRP
ncbi:MAG: hypothetical protein WAU78_13125, partial [Roseiarcus sp.]